MESKSFYCDLVGRKLESTFKRYIIVAAWLHDDRVRALAVDDDFSTRRIDLPDIDFQLKP